MENRQSQNLAPVSVGGDDQFRQNSKGIGHPKWSVLSTSKNR